jgi:hypothetical protein
VLTLFASRCLTRHVPKQTAHFFFQNNSFLTKRICNGLATALCAKMEMGSSTIVVRGGQKNEKKEKKPPII